MQTFGQRLEKVIEEKKIRIIDIADNIGISRGAIYKYINHEAEPTISNLLKLSNFLQVAPLFLLTGSVASDLPIRNYPIKKINIGDNSNIKSYPLKDEHPHDSFFVIVNDESMASMHSQYRQFFKGDMVLVYPSESPKDGDYVLARHRDKDIVAVRYYLAQGGIVLLRVGNSIFESLNGNLETYEVLGVIKQQIVRFE